MKDGWICFGVLEEVGIYPKKKYYQRRKEMDWNLDGGSGPLSIRVCGGETWMDGSWW